MCDGWVVIYNRWERLWEILDATSSNCAILILRSDPGDRIPCFVEGFFFAKWYGIAIIHLQLCGADFNENFSPFAKWNALYNQDF